MPTYQRAYHLRDLRRSPQWNEDKYRAGLPETCAGRVDGNDADPSTSARPPGELTDDSIVFLHEDLVVTSSCFDRDTVIFDQVTPAWEAFCRDALGFSVPDWEAESAAVREKLAAGNVESSDADGAEGRKEQ